MTTWAEAQRSEVEWWDSCSGGLLWAEVEQIEMARRMGLEVDDRFTVYTSGTIWDVGGGPLSLLLKAVGWTQAVVVDPAPYPKWTTMRYHAAGIDVRRMAGESAFLSSAACDADEVWIYNTLQHVEDPELLVTLAIQNAPVLRLFEWIEQGTNECHLHTLHADEIERWVTEAGAEPTGMMDELNGVACYHGIFAR